MYKEKSIVIFVSVSIIIVVIVFGTYQQSANRTMEKAIQSANETGKMLVKLALN
jgi:uncharacterized membrane protein affecting hemolysin expression